MRPAPFKSFRGRTYAAAVWVRASRPGTVVQVTLLEVADGRRLAADTIGAVLRLGRWQRVEVTHLAHRSGAALAFEVVLPQGSPRATVLVDDLAADLLAQAKRVRAAERAALATADADGGPAT